MTGGKSEPFRGKILFVDDETNILRSLQREFIDTEYEIYLASSALEGTKILEAENIDIVVSDYKMPGINGIEFLRIVMKQSPATCRVILSGFVDEYSVLKALSSGLVSAYIPKPWETEALHKEINHCFLTRHILRNTEILKTVNSIENIPTLPDVYNKLVRAVEEERPYNEITLIISRDIASTTRLLRIAGSAYYHLDKDISVERALSYIGINALRQLVLFASLADGAQWSNARREHLQSISVHSVLVNYGLYELYKIEFERPLPEHYTSIGITHDIGKVIMLGHLSDRFEAVVACMKNHPGMDFYQSELALGFEGATHGEIGAFFLDLWGLPASSVEASLCHHGFKEREADGQPVREVCRMADMLANYVVLHPDAAKEGLPVFLERYAHKNKSGIYDLMATLAEKFESLR
jgi:HD-like signal output (HDOD) protein